VPLNQYFNKSDILDQCGIKTHQDLENVDKKYVEFFGSERKFGALSQIVHTTVGSGPQIANHLSLVDKNGLPLFLAQKSKI